MASYRRSCRNREQVPVVVDLPQTLLTSVQLDALRRNVGQVREQIRAACVRAGRGAAEVRLLAVTKYVDAGTIRALLDLGIRDLGENRVQQLIGRVETLGADLSSPWDQSSIPAGRAAGPAPRWHLIGHLQRNKIRAACAATRTVHSADSTRLLEGLQAHAAQLNTTLDVFLEINVAGESSKSGAPLAEAEGLVESAARHPNLRPRGWMTMAPYADNPENSRPVFAALRELRDRSLKNGAAPPGCTGLSMGMSGDFVVAIEEGATWVRIGSALYQGVSA